MDLVLPCSTVVLTDTLVLPTDGANCRDTILVDPILVGQVLAQNVLHNEFFRRVWAVELGSSWLKRFVAWVQEIQEQEQKEVSVKRDLSQMIRSQTGLMGTDSYKIKFLYNVLSALSLSVFPSPSLGGLLHII